MLLGTSRKSMIGLSLDLPVDQRVEGTLATTVVGVMKGCSRFVRVHDIGGKQTGHSDDGSDLKRVITWIGKFDGKGLTGWDVWITLKIKKLDVFAKHGVYKEENVLGQKFVFSAVLYLDTAKAGVGGELEGSGELRRGVSFCQGVC